jgi:type III restriction enzyme
MKLHFEPNLDYQLDAIEAVCDLFRGQETSRTEFTVTDRALNGRATLGLIESDLGIGNRLTLLDDEILANLSEIQLRNGIPQSSTLASGDFTVEMETGTGKTYVYLRTIFELNRRYGFTKFVIVVPSIAIKEGVYKTLQITEDHLRSLYSGVPFDYFLYDSAKLGQVRNFATSQHIQVMVVTVGAINKKDVNNLYKDSEKTGGERPIDLIGSTRPVVIVDEPQSVDGGLEGRGKQALDAMRPLCTLRYSATHADKHHMIYRLDAVDAYDRRLVKQIEVASATVEDAYNHPYVRLVKTARRGNEISARVEVDVETASGVRRQEVTVYDGYDLEEITRRHIYQHVRIGEIRAPGYGSEYLELRVPGGEEYLKPGMASGDVDPLRIQREMIRRTISEHLEKELRLRPQGIKVLSLFFIDQVARYRRYDAEGHAQKGEYATIFEEEYARAARNPHFHTLFEGVDLSHAADEVHDGYFSIDRKGGWTDTSEANQGDRDNAERAYNLIMRDKERLLSLDTPLKFIFSHSALREGWDNPNVFQICSLRDIRTERERRQTIGRGLRLCVNQDGERVRGFTVNTLTVVATESYEEFAENLQREIEHDTGIRFGVVERHQFQAVPVAQADGTTLPLGGAESEAIWDSLRAAGYIDSRGKVQDSLRVALKAGTLKLPDAFTDQEDQVTSILTKLAGRLDIKNADERKVVRTREAVLHSAEFRALWDRIKHKTTYRVQFDNERLIEECTDALRDAPPVKRTRLQWRKADIAIGEAGVVATKQDHGDATITIDESDIELPDILTSLQDRTQLTRRSIHRILTGSGRLGDFRRNPQEFIHLTFEAIDRRKRLAIIDGIKYQRLGDDHYYAQELFENKELTSYVRNLVPATRCVYEDVVYSHGVERSFAEQLEANASVKVYAKLPAWFQVSTPLGPYNPDWAVLVEDDDGERLYLVIETKSGLFEEQLRPTEAAKIKCARVHFDAIAVTSSSARYIVADSLTQVLAAT